MNRILGMAVVPLLAGSVLAAPPVGAAADALRPGEVVERELAAGESHAYRLTLKEGRFVFLALDQRGIDVRLNSFRLVHSSIPMTRSTSALV